MGRVYIRKGDKISLAVLVREDAPILYKVINDPEVHKFLSKPEKIYSLVEEYEWIDNIANVDGQSMNLAIIRNDDETTVGVIGLNPITDSKSAHVGYFIQKESWGKGYTTEALGLIMDFAFNVMNLRKLYTNVYEPNMASRRVVEKNGFLICGTKKKEHFIPYLGYVDENIFEVFNPKLKDFS
jgi:RimJ/RimL family protein N-acetyltransferase